MILVHPIYTNPSRFGVVRIKKITNLNEALYGEVNGLVEKPDPKIAETYQTNGCYLTIAGYYVFNSRIFKYIERTKSGVNNKVQITDSISLALKEGEKVYAIIHGKKLGNKIIPYQYWDVGIPEDYKKANKKLSELEIGKYFI